MQINEPQTSVYIKLLVYNWDTSPRTHFVRHFVGTNGQPSASSRARHLAHRLEQTIKANRNCGRLKWLDKHHHVDGFIERVDGVFVQTIERVA